MSKEYFIDNISDEALAKITDKMLNFEKNNKNRGIKRNIFKVISAAAAIALVIGLVNFAVFLNMYAPPVANEAAINDWDERDFSEESILIDDEMTGEEHPENPISEEKTALSRKPQGESYTFLILGRDGTGLLTDSILLITFHVKENKIAVLSIPRDCYINSSSYKGKINSVLAVGFNAARSAGKTRDESLTDGIDFLRQMIKITFGIPIDYYISMDLNGFKAIVDAVGGVEIDVPIDMVYDDPAQNLHINLRKGVQTLYGDAAEQLVRYRAGYAAQDIGRIETQKIFLSALVKKILKFNPVQIDKLTDVIQNHTVTDLSLTDAGWFAAKALGIKLENIILHTVPGESFWVGKAACYAIYKPETIQIINSHFNPYAKDIPTSNFNIFESSRIYANQADIAGTTMDKLTGN